MRSVVIALAAAGVIWCAAPVVANEISPVAAAQSDATDFSSRTKVVVRDGRRDRWHRNNQHCRTVVTKRWSHGRRIVKRTRICR